MGGLFDVSKKQTELEDLTNQLNDPAIWENIDKSSTISKEINRLKKQLTTYNDLKSSIDYITEYISILDPKNQETLNEITKEILNINILLEELETNTLLNEEYDSSECYIEIHPGAGGTESCDWAYMLERMYQRFCDKIGYEYEVIDEQKGDEAGIKSATILIKGEYAYGYLKNEIGVHRLVRISPFDSNKRRHTSFASIMVIPKFNEEINIEIKDSDLKVDVYRSSGAGGQSVNTTDSAVRITHIPTKTVVTCQNERSQLKNKEQAMRILKDKLYQQELMKQNEKINDSKGQMMNIDFGSQIRNYVLYPYTLVKDNRNNFETAQADKVLDGDIIELIKSLLKNK